jgi:MFS family permease
MDVFDPRKAMKYVTAEGITASVMFAITDSYLAVFAAALGASNTQIGLLIAIPAALALISYIPAAYATEKMNSRRLMSTAFSFISRFAWFFVGLIPFLLMWNVLTGVQESFTLLLIIVSLYSLLGAFIGPAWASMVGVIVPENIRGSYFGRRNQLCAIGSLIAGTAAGFVVQFLGNNMMGFAFIFMAASIAGILSSYSFSRFPDIRFRPENIRLISEIKSAFREKGFRRFILILMLWQFGVSMSAPFMNVYLIEGLGAEYVWLSAIIFASGVATIISQRWWGSVSDVFGHRSVIIISAFGAALIPWLWMIAPTPGFTVLINILSGASWAGFNLAVFNYLLDISKGGKRTVYSAIYWTLTEIPILVAPIIGGLMIDVLTFSPGFDFSGFQGMFLVSGALRLAAAVLFAYLLVEAPPRVKLPAKYVFREAVNIGVHSMEQPVQVLKNQNLDHMRWHLMMLLTDIKKLGLSGKIRDEVQRIEDTLRPGGKKEGYPAAIRRLQGIRDRLKK